MKFESAGLWRERSECYGDVHQFVRFVAIRNDPGIGIGDSAHIVFLLGHLKEKEKKERDVSINNVFILYYSRCYTTCRVFIPHTGYMGIGSLRYYIRKAVILVTILWTELIPLYGILILRKNILYIYIIYVTGKKWKLVNIIPRDLYISSY